MREIVNASTQDKVQSIAPASCRTSRTMIPATAYTDAVATVSSRAAKNIATANPARAFSSRTSSAGFTFLSQSLVDGGGRDLLFLLSRSSLRICPFHYLVDSLSGKVELVCYLAKASTGRPQFMNSYISWNIRRRPRTKRTPLPPGNTIELDDSFYRKLIFSFSLPHVSDPCTQSNFFSFDNFNMHSRNSTMAIAHRKLLQSQDVIVKSCFIVHSQDNNSRPVIISATISFKKLQIVLTKPAATYSI